MFCRHLYLDEALADDFNSIRRKFRSEKYPSGTFVITLSKTSGRVEYFDCKAFKQKYYKETGNYPLIIGLAKNAENAQNIVIKIIEEAYANKGNADVRAYLKEKIETVKYAPIKKYDITVIKQESEN